MRAIVPWLLLSVSFMTVATSTTAGTVIVLHKSANTARLLDEATGRVLADLPTGTAPHEVAVSPDGGTAVVANYGDREPGSSLTVIDVAAARVVRTIELEAGGVTYHRPHGLQFLSDGRRVVATSEENRSLLVVDITSGKVTGVVPTGQDISHMVALAPGGARAFVANIRSGTVTVIDLEGGQVLGHVDSGEGTEGIDVHPDGSEVWATNRAADTISIIDAQTLDVLERIECASFPIRVKFTPDGHSALVSCAGSGEVAVFDVKTRKEVQRISMGMTAKEKTEGRLFGDTFGESPVPIGILIRPDGARAWIANTQADMLTVIDLEALEVTGRVETGAEPDGLGWSAVSAASPAGPGEG